MVDLYTVMTCYFADAMEEVDRVAEGQRAERVSWTVRHRVRGQSWNRYTARRWKLPIEGYETVLDGILHIHDEGRTRMSMGALFGIVEEAEERLSEKKIPWHLDK